MTQVICWKEAKLRDNFAFHYNNLLCWKEAKLREKIGDIEMAKLYVEKKQN